MELVQSVLSKTWIIFKEHYVNLLRMFCIIFIVNLIISILAPSLENGSVQYIAYRLASNLFSMGLTVGAIKILLNLLSGQEITLEKLFKSFDLLIPYMLGYVIIGILLLILLIPFSQWIAPNEDLFSIMSSFLSGNVDEIAVAVLENFNVKFLFIYLIFCFYVWIKVQFFPYYIAEQEVGPVEAIKASYALTEDHFFDLISYFFIILFINIMGAILFGLGLIFTIPFSFVGMVVMFNQLKEKTSIDE